MSMKWPYSYTIWLSAYVIFTMFNINVRSLCGLSFALKEATPANHITPTFLFLLTLPDSSHLEEQLMRKDLKLTSQYSALNSFE